MTQTQVAKGEERGVRGTDPVRTDRIQVPNVDIHENEAGFRLLADMPGVEAGSVDVSVENDVLTIQGEGHVAPPDGYELVGREYDVGRYRRDFALSGEMNAEGIRARMQHGVLDVTIPKREAVRKRKIAIEA